MITLETLRKKKDYSHERLAVALDVSTTTVRNWEKARILPEKMPVHVFVRMAKLYDISLEALHKAIKNTGN